MISGRVALGGLTWEFGNAKQRFERLAQEVEALTKAQTKLLADETEVVEKLARTYLPELTPEAVSAGLGELQETMQAALAEQASHRRALVERLSELPEDIARRELLVAEAEGAEERAARGLDAVRLAVEQELGSDPEHAPNVSVHRTIMERRSILKTRRSRLQTTSNGERHKYEESRAFSYLMKRQFSEPEYRGRFLARWLDGWLARRIGYEVLLRNYRILKTGPHAVQAEIRELSAEAEGLDRAIDEQEKEVADRLGLMAALEAEAAVQRGLVDAREALGEARSRHDRLVAEIRAVDANRGRPYENALATHWEFLEDRTIRELEKIARSTADPRDDELVSKLDEIRSRLEEIGSKLGPLREDLDRQSSRTTSLADLARNAVTHFASRRSHFPEEFSLQKLVQSLVDENATTEDTLSRIAESHVKEPLLLPSSVDFDGWFAELSSQFDPELGAVSVRIDEGSDFGSEMVVYDHHGRVVQRRVTRRKIGVP